MMSSAIDVDIWGKLVKMFAEGWPGHVNEADDFHGYKNAFKKRIRGNVLLFPRKDILGPLTV